MACSTSTRTADGQAPQFFSHYSSECFVNHQPRPKQEGLRFLVCRQASTFSTIPSGKPKIPYNIEVLSLIARLQPFAMTMTTSGSARRTIIAQAIMLLSHYGFDTKPHTTAERMGHWLDLYAADWIRAAIIEALYQGRYKAISVEHILTLWQKRGHPAPHFTGDFERIICRKLPEWYMTLANPELAEAESEFPAVPLTTVGDGRTHSPLQIRIQGIERWRYLAQVGEVEGMEEKAIARLKCFVYLDLTGFWPLDDSELAVIPVVAASPEGETPEDGVNLPMVFAEDAGGTEAIALEEPLPETLASEPAAVPCGVAIAPSSTAHPPLALPNPQAPLFRSGIRTFIPVVVMSAFFLRLQRFQVQSVLVVMDREGDQWFNAEVEQLTLPMESI